MLYKFTHKLTILINYLEMLSKGGSTAHMHVFRLGSRSGKHRVVWKLIVNCKMLSIMNEWKPWDSLSTDCKCKHNETASVDKCYVSFHLLCCRAGFGSYRTRLQVWCGPWARGASGGPGVLPRKNWKIIGAKWWKVERKVQVKSKYLRMN